MTWSQSTGACSTITYGELQRHIEAAAHRLLCWLGRDGDAPLLAILAHNDASYVVNSLACMAIGGVAIHLNWRMPAATLGQQLCLLRCTALLVSASLEGLGRDAAAAAASLSLTVRVKSLSDPSLDTAEPEAAAPAAGSGVGEPSHERLAIVFFTSGSTGNPKAIPHTHAGLLWWARSYAASLPAVFPPSVPPDEFGSLSFAPCAAAAPWRTPLLTPRRS